MGQTPGNFRTTITRAAKADLKGSGLHQETRIIPGCPPTSLGQESLLHCCVPVSGVPTASCLLIRLLSAFSQDLLNVKVIFVVPAAPFLEGWDWEGREMAVLHIW